MTKAGYGTGFQISEFIDFDRVSVCAAALRICNLWQALKDRSAPLSSHPARARCAYHSNTSRVHRTVIMLNTRLSERVFLKLQSQRMEPRWN